MGEISKIVACVCLRVSVCGYMRASTNQSITFTIQIRTLFCTAHNHQVGKYGYTGNPEISMMQNDTAIRHSLLCSGVFFIVLWALVHQI